jgi:nucleoside-diphosphate-sugar epimerase
MSTGVHVIFGVGQVGSQLAKFLMDDGASVRVVKRSPRGVPAGAEGVFGDASDASFCRSAVEGARAVYHCMNPAYDAKTWARVLPVLQENLVSAAGSVGARLVVLENLYMLGSPRSGTMNEDTPFRPQSRKGEVRARLAEALLEAHSKGRVQAVSGRASDFYGPYGTETHFGERFWVPAIAGKRAEFLPRLDTRHSYNFIPDVARGLALLGTGPEEIVGRPWMLPCAPAETSRDLIHRFSAALGEEIRPRGLPRPLIRILGVFIPILKEVGETLPQWDSDYVVDDSRFRAQFRFGGTSLQTGAEATARWAKAEWAAS